MDETITTSPGMEPEFPTMTDAEIAAMDVERREAEEAKLAPCKEASAQRRNNTAVISEHDELLADMLYEITMAQFGEEV